MELPSEALDKKILDRKTLKKAYALMYSAKIMADTYDEHRNICSKYVHSTSRGHEAIQLAAGLQLKPFDYAAVYYRDESIMLGIGVKPYELMLQLMAKADDPFSGGRTYYNHPSLKRKGFPVIPHQSSATGMQAIPATGMAHAIKYLELQGLGNKRNKPLVLCSIGDGAITEGEVSEAFQMAVLKELPIVYLVQDNEWGISAQANELRAMNAYEFAAGYKGLERVQVDGADFIASFEVLKKAFSYTRSERKPILIHAKCPLLGHHTSGVRKEWYRSEENLSYHYVNDPLPKLRKVLLESNIYENEVRSIEEKVIAEVIDDFNRAVAAPDPDPKTLLDHEFAPTPVKDEAGVRVPENGEKVLMVEAALHAMDEILSKHPEALFYGQDVGKQLGGVFREAVNLAEKHGDGRVFNTPIQEAYIIGSTVGMSAVGCKPIVEIQFADYIWPGINQLVEEASKSCYLSKGQFPVQALIRVPFGAYGGGGPYHSGSIESTLLNIKGIKVVCPSNAADIKGLLKSAFYDPNPVVMLEHKGLYWSKLEGTEGAKTIEPDENYIVPLGKAHIVLEADPVIVSRGGSVLIITYGMGVYWAKAASLSFKGVLEILDLRSLNPLDMETIIALVIKHSKVLVLTEEPLSNSFAESLAGRISLECFKYLDAPVMTLGAENLPAVPLNIGLEKAMLPNAEKLIKLLNELIAF